VTGGCTWDSSGIESSVDGSAGNVDSVVRRPGRSSIVDKGLSGTNEIVDLSLGVCGACYDGNVGTVEVVEDNGDIVGRRGYINITTR